MLVGFYVFVDSLSASDSGVTTDQGHTVITCKFHWSRKPEAIEEILLIFQMWFKSCFYFLSRVLEFRINIKRLTQGEWQECLTPHKVAIAVQKPLWWENTWIVPVLLIKVHWVEVCDHHGAFGNCVPVHFCILGGGTENTKWDNVAKAKDLVQNSLYVRHLLFVLQSGCSPIGQQAVDLSVHPLFAGKKQTPSGIYLYITLHNHYI